MSTPTMREGSTLDRRSFLKVSMLASGALMVGVGSCGVLLAGETGKETWKPNLYVRIDPDGKILSKDLRGEKLYAKVEELVREQTARNAGD